MMMMTNFSSSSFFCFLFFCLLSSCTNNNNKMMLMTTNAFVVTSATASAKSRTLSLPRLNSALQDLTSKLVVDVPSVNIPSMDALSGSGLNLDPLVLGGSVVAVLGVVAVVASSFLSGSGKDNASSSSSTRAAATAAAKEPEPEVVDVSIPYNAAALLAYQQTVIGRETTTDDDEFAEFEQLYQQMAVAQVIVKQKERALQRLQQEFASKYPSAVQAPVQSTNADAAVNGSAVINGSGGSVQETVNA
jgi:hypothetical protein